MHRLKNRSFLPHSNFAASHFSSKSLGFQSVLWKKKFVWILSHVTQDCFSMFPNANNTHMPPISPETWQWLLFQSLELGSYQGTRVFIADCAKLHLSWVAGSLWMTMHWIKSWDLTFCNSSLFQSVRLHFSFIFWLSLKNNFYCKHHYSAQLCFWWDWKQGY